MQLAWAGGEIEQSLTPLIERPAAPGFDLVDIDGQRHTLAQHRGKVLIVNFWATWCPPSREEMPSMERAWQAVKNENILLLGINVGETEDQVWSFTVNYPVSFPLLLDHDRQTITAWPVQGLPTTFVIDPKGRLAYRAIGGRAWDDPVLLEIVRALHSQVVQ
jgi:peroxiredoxin